jgi:hypothetical protein
MLFSTRFVGRNKPKTANQTWSRKFELRCLLRSKKARAKSLFKNHKCFKRFALCKCAGPSTVGKNVLKRTGMAVKKTKSAKK